MKRNADIGLFTLPSMLIKPHKRSVMEYIGLIAFVLYFGDAPFFFQWSGALLDEPKAGCFAAGKAQNGDAPCERSKCGVFVKLL